MPRAGAAFAICVTHFSATLYGEASLEGERQRLPENLYQLIAGHAGLLARLLQALERLGSFFRGAREGIHRKPQVAEIIGVLEPSPDKVESLLNPECRYAHSGERRSSHRGPARDGSQSGLDAAQRGSCAYLLRGGQDSLQGSLKFIRALNSALDVELDI